MGDREVEFDTRIKLVGDSKFILIPTNEIKILEAEEGDIVHAIISRPVIVIQSYQCKLCGHKFDSDDLEPYCPSCEADTIDLKLIFIDEDENSKNTELKGGEKENGDR